MKRKSSVVTVVLASTKRGKQVEWLAALEQQGSRMRKSDRPKCKPVGVFGLMSEFLGWRGRLHLHWITSKKPLFQNPSIQKRLVILHQGDVADVMQHAVMAAGFRRCSSQRCCRTWKCAGGNYTFNMFEVTYEFTFLFDKSGLGGTLKLRAWPPIERRPTDPFVTCLCANQETLSTQVSRAVNNSLRSLLYVHHLPHHRSHRR